MCTGSLAGVRIGSDIHPITQRPLRVNDILSIVANTPLENLLLERAGDFEQVLEYNARQLHVKVTRPPGSIQLIIREHSVSSSLSLDLDEPPFGEIEPATVSGSISSRTATAPAMAQVKSEPAPLTLPQLLQNAQAEGVSDIHLMSDEPARVRRVG